MLRLGVVSFLNARPLVQELDRQPDVQLHSDVPARLESLLAEGAVDIALLPVIDVIRSGGQCRIISDACIACDGETMTVRVFSQIPPHRVRRLHADLDSHTSVALAAVLWRELFDAPLELVPFDARAQRPEACESVLLIGDKVVDPARGSFAYEVDLGGAWRQHTGLPFVFAVWAAGERWSARTERERHRARQLLQDARDRGAAAAERIAREQGPALGWPIELAVRYLTRCLSFRIGPRFVEGANLFARRCAALELARFGEIEWPDELAGVETIP
jgi:chorismate dehydratase